MKKYLLFSAVLVAMMVAGCGKERACRCVPQGGTYADRTMVYMDNGMSCKSVKRLGYERQMEGKLVRTLVEVECEDATNEENQKE